MKQLVWDEAKASFSCRWQAGEEPHCEDDRKTPVLHSEVGVGAAETAGGKTHLVTLPQRNQADRLSLRFKGQGGKDMSKGDNENKCS